MISRWFVRRRAAAIGLAYTVSGLGALFMESFLVYVSYVYGATLTFGWGGGGSPPSFWAASYW